MPTDPKKRNATHKWRERNRAHLREYDRKYNARFPLRHIKKYGLTEEAFWALFEAQGGLCPICETPMSGRGIHGPNVDHCHVTGKVRALLCGRCNIICGYLEHPRRRAAEAYLKKHAQAAGSSGPWLPTSTAF